jgi:hypothetical protein
MLEKNNMGKETQIKNTTINKQSSIVFVGLLLAFKSQLDLPLN